MNKLERFAKASWNLLKDSYNYSNEQLSKATETPESFEDVLQKNYQLKTAAAPFIFVLGTYIAIVGSALFGTYKGGEYVYNKVKNKIEHNQIIKNLEDIPSNIVLPEEYGQKK
jgi:hypothetical protein